MSESFRPGDKVAIKEGRNGAGRVMTVSSATASAVHTIESGHDVWHQPNSLLLIRARKATGGVGKKLEREAAARLTRKPPKYTEKRGWHGGDSRTLYAFTDKRTGGVFVFPGGRDRIGGIGPECTVRMATHSEAVAKWQSPLHSGWKVA